jgi:hypothetical protein
MSRAVGRHTLAVVFGLSVTLAGANCAADKFFFRDARGDRVALEARLVAFVQGTYILETSDGRYHLVPRGAAEKREAAPGPAPLTAAEFATRLQKEFSADLFRSHAQEPFLVGLVLAAPLPKTSEGQAKSLLREAAGFLKNVDSAFGRYARDVRIEAQAPAAPIVALVFESRADFVKYATAVTEREESVVRRAAGFYSKVTNILAMRMDECRTFETPLHEAIHQQVYARGVFQRLAPIPAWFDEGLAAGFEANAGKINVGPGKVSVRYANQALEAQRVQWADLLASDDPFAQAARMNDAYGQAWGLHWLLVTRYKTEYAAYMRLLGQKKPLEEDSPEQRQADFRQAFGDRLADMQSQFRTALEAAVRRQGTVLKPPSVKGLSVTEEDLGRLQLTAVRHQTPGPPGTRLEVHGTLTNLSPLRPLAFHVTVETDAATYAEWLVPQLASLQSTSLPAQDATKAMRIPAAKETDAPAEPATGVRTFRVHIRSAPATSDEAQRWRAGQLPIPVFSRE